MDRTEAITLREPWDVERRLAEIKLGPRFRLIEVVRVALSASADATPFHAANAAGTFAYHHGIWALRDEFVDRSTWKLGRPNGVEVIQNDDLRVRVAFSNVDIACDDGRKPKPRSHKGTGSEQVCSGNQSLFEHLPEYAPLQRDGWLMYYLMVDEKGAAELTRPIVKNSTFTAWPERLYLSDGSDINIEPEIQGDDASEDEFDPVVVRK